MSPDLLKCLEVYLLENESPLFRIGTDGRVFVVCKKLQWDIGLNKFVKIGETVEEISGEEEY
tara:strand:+ start:64 stop:249 length:186 start_codon:yes stop_codon:yes gene_type:complete